MSKKKISTLQGIAHNAANKFESYSCLPLIRKFLDETNRTEGEFTLDIKARELTPSFDLDRDSRNVMDSFCKWFQDEVEQRGIRFNDISSAKVYFKYSPQKFLQIFKFYKYWTKVSIDAHGETISKEVTVKGWV